MSNKSDLVKQELEALAEEHNGILKPQAVVDFARNPDTALHSHFEWDDGKAAEAHRLWQARQVIKMVVTIIETEKEEVQVSTFVSLPNDRKNGDGYRLTVDVLSDDERRKQLLGAAHKDFKLWQTKYQQLKVLEPVFKRMDEVMAAEVV